MYKLNLNKMATNPSPDIEVLKNQPKRKHYHFPGETVIPSEYKKDSNKPFEDLEEEEGWENPNNFFYERKYLDL